MLHKRNHLAIFYDDLWAEHVRLSTGKVIKPFQDRHKLGSFSLEEGFKKHKPTSFKEVDLYFYNMFKEYLDFIQDFIIKADNRMKQGDFRYGLIIRQNLDNYDVVKEFFRRRDVATKTKNLEYVIDAYNMYRIQSFKSKDKETLHLLECNLIILMFTAIHKKWKLTSVDDGIHAQEL